MPSDLVNAVSPPKTHRTPQQVPAGAQPRANGFDGLVRSEGEDDRSEKSADGVSEVQSGFAAMLGVPGFFAPPAPAVEQPATGAAGDSAPAVGSAVAPATAATASAKQVPAPQATDARAPAATLAAALQAQVDGLTAGRTMGQSAGEALAASGVVRLHGTSAPEDLTFGAAKGEAAPSTPAIAATGEAKTAKSGASEAASIKAGASKDAKVLADGAVAKAAADAESEVPQMSEIKPAEAGARPEAVRAPVERIQALQTSAAPATPAAQAGQQVTGGAVAAAVQVANEIASHAASRRSRFEIRLDPGDLGKVDVRLDIASDGRVATRLIVERVETLDMLRNDARELTRTLEQAGFQLGQGGLAFQLKDGRQTFRVDEAGTSRAGSSEDIDDVAPVAAAYSRSRAAGAGGVDVKV